MKLCYVTRTLANEFWGYERDGFEAEAKKLGVQFQTYAVNDESSITEQLDKAQSAMNQGCSAILASPISATALDSVFRPPWPRVSRRSCSTTPRAPSPASST